MSFPSELKCAEHLHAALLVAIQSVLSNHLGKLGVGPGNVPRHRDVHWGGVEEPHRHTGVAVSFVPAVWFPLRLPANHLQHNAGCLENPLHRPQSQTTVLLDGSESDDCIKMSNENFNSKALNWKGNTDDTSDTEVPYICICKLSYEFWIISYCFFFLWFSNF